MKQQKLNQLAQIIKRLEHILDPDQTRNSQYSLFHLFPTFQPDEQTSSEQSEQSTNQIIFDESPTHDYTKNDLQRLSTESVYLKLDYIQISIQLRNILLNCFKNLNVDSVNHISELFLQNSQKDNPYSALIINQINLIQSVIETHSICSKFNTQILNLSFDFINIDQYGIIEKVITIRSNYFAEINKHKINEILVPQYDQFQLIKEQQLKIKQTEQAIEKLIQKFC